MTVPEPALSAAVERPSPCVPSGALAGGARCPGRVLVGLMAHARRLRSRGLDGVIGKAR
jgi:hypothetical protein